MNRIGGGTSWLTNKLMSVSKGVVLAGEWRTTREAGIQQQGRSTGKFAYNRPGDKYEQEADRVAARAATSTKTTLTQAENHTPEPLESNYLSGGHLLGNLSYCWLIGLRGLAIND